MKKDLSYKEISLILDYLTGRLPNQPTAVNGIYIVPKPIMEKLKNQQYPNEPLQKLSDNIGYFLGILGSIKVKYVKETVDGVWLSIDGEVISNFNHIENAGLYKVKGFDHSEIFLFQKQRYKTEQVLAVLAHEYAHHYLHLKNIVKEKQWANELMTDIAAVYLGLGKLLYKGYKPIKWTSDYKYYGTHSEYKTNKIEIGYISQATIRKAILLSALRRNWKPIEAAYSFPGISKKIWTFLAINFIMLFRRFKDKGLHLSKSKLCPFCKKLVSSHDAVCPHCTRILFEKTSNHNANDYIRPIQQKINTSNEKKLFKKTIEANKGLVKLFEQKIKDKISEVWGR